MESYISIGQHESPWDSISSKSNKSGVTPVIFLTDRIKFCRIAVRKSSFFHTTFGLHKKVTLKLLHVSLPLSSAAGMMDLCTCTYMLNFSNHIVPI